MVMLGTRLLIITCISLIFVLGLFYVHLYFEVSELRSYLLKQGSNSFHHSPNLLSQSITDRHQDNLVIIYNRVAKTGSTTLIGLSYSLCYTNKFNVIHMNTSKNAPGLSLTDQVRLVRNISLWDARKPAIYHGHIAYLDFKRFGVDVAPMYINMIRKPMDRFISSYYFLRYGDDFRPYLVRKRQGDKMTLDECVDEGHTDCAPARMWVQIPFFCGQVQECWVAGSKWALKQAMFNLVNNYFLVGVTEEMEDFVALLEYSLPRFFRGALSLYMEGKVSHLRKTIKKIAPHHETVQILQDSVVWKLENEFYQFALENFHSVRNKTLMRDKFTKTLVDKGQFFEYQKIKPKK